ncbi:MAG: hypothetical protein HYY18_02870 [Planctomycetes bacterium]|nr:hypothetical protein [Planctomycetota bacterium]
MDDKIGTASLRPYDDSPGYDLISLGLVVFVTLLIGVWGTYFFRQPPPGIEDYTQVRNRTDLSTPAGHLELARWTEFNLKTVHRDHLPLEFKEHLQKALVPGASPEARAWAREWYGRRSAFLEARDRQAFNAAAHLELAELCQQVGMEEEAKREREKILKVRHDFPGLRR